MESNRVVVDVRTKIEFMMGHAEGSINIPMEGVGRISVES